MTALISNLSNDGRVHMQVSASSPFLQGRSRVLGCNFQNRKLARLRQCGFSLPSSSDPPAGPKVKH